MGGGGVGCTVAAAAVSCYTQEEDEKRRGPAEVDPGESANGWAREVRQDGVHFVRRVGSVSFDGGEFVGQVSGGPLERFSGVPGDFLEQFYLCEAGQGGGDAEVLR